MGCLFLNACIAVTMTKNIVNSLKRRFLEVFSRTKGVYFKPNDLHTIKKVDFHSDQPFLWGLISPCGSYGKILDVE